MAPSGRLWSPWDLALCRCRAPEAALLIHVMCAYTALGTRSNVRSVLTGCSVRNGAKVQPCFIGSSAILGTVGCRCLQPR